MKVVMDTNSLLALVRYYLPFDNDKVLINFFKNQIEIGNILIIDKVISECEYISKGIILSQLPFLNDIAFLKSSKTPIKTDSLIAPNTKQFFHQLNFVFVNNPIKRKLNEIEFENQMNLFIESADLKQIILCLNLIKDGEFAVLVTEETESSNDNKLFKKIPAICKELKIPTMTLPELLNNFDGINIYFK